MYQITSCACAIVLGLGSAAYAATISYTQDIELKEFDGSATILSQPFDTTLGSLTGVSLLLSGGQAVFIRAVNSFPQGMTGSVFFSGGLLVPGNLATSDITGVGDFTTGPQSATGSGFVQITDEVSLTPYTLGLYNGVNVGPSGKVDIQLNLNLPTFILPGVGGELTGIGSVQYSLSGIFMETFTYTPRSVSLPEPGTITLVVAGLIAIGVASRRQTITR